MSYAEITDGIDLLVATGGQYLADVVRYLAFCVLGRLDLAIQRGIPTVMVGQGIGPIEDSELIARAREVLPKVDVILIREKMYAPHLFASLGVSPERLFLTGDDAVEMAYDARSDGFGKEIGIGMRVTHYSEIEDDHLVALRQTLSEASRKHEARLMPIPISHHEFELDDQVIRYISAGKLARDRGLHVLDSPLDIIKKTGKCRVVVTGAYHPAVFALAQGIPAVCLSKSDHYANKFIGLADLFGRGCQVVFFDDVQFKEKLGDAIDFAWRSAETVRPELLEAARSQVEWGHAGYQRVHDLVDFKYHNVSRTLGQGTAFIGRQ
jgi:polysaccharide pyruvyl transferase WcaK-like protein